MERAPLGHPRFPFFQCVHKTLKRKRTEKPLILSHLFLSHVFLDIQRSASGLLQKQVAAVHMCSLDLTFLTQVCDRWGGFPVRVTSHLIPQMGGRPGSLVSTEYRARGPDTRLSTMNCNWGG